MLPVYYFEPRATSTAIVSCRGRATVAGSKALHTHTAEQFFNKECFTDTGKYYIPLSTAHIVSMTLDSNTQFHFAFIETG